MRAWYAYWATLLVGVIVWLGAIVVGGRDGLASMLASPVGLTVLVLPIVVAGVNLIVYRHSHEEVCRLQVERHRSMRLVAGNGYSAAMFGATGVALLVVAAVLIVATLTNASQPGPQG